MNRILVIDDDRELCVLIKRSIVVENIEVNGTFELPPKEFDLLLVLAKNQGKILAKQRIYEAVWRESYFYDDSNIMAIISRQDTAREEEI